MRRALATLAISCSAGMITQSAAATISLGTAADFGVLAASTVTSTGLTVITGDVGVSPGSAITGFPPGIVHGTIRSNDAVSILAQADAAQAYSDILGLAPTQSLTGMDLAGMTLTPGVYFFASSAQLSGVLFLDSQGVPGAEFIFQIGSTLTTAGESSIIGLNGTTGSNVYFQVGSSATLGTYSEFMGTIIAHSSISLTTGAEMDGRALALGAAVTLDNNQIGISAVPEPSSMLGLGCLVGCGLTLRGRRRLPALAC